MHFYASAVVGNAFGSVRLSVCMCVRMRNSKTIAPIYARSVIPVARSSSEIIGIWNQQARIYLTILQHWEIGQNMPSKYGMK